MTTANMSSQTSSIPTGEGLRPDPHIPNNISDSSRSVSKITDDEHRFRLSAIGSTSSVAAADDVGMPTTSTAVLSDETTGDRSGQSVDPSAIDEAKSVAGSGYAVDSVFTLPTTGSDYVVDPSTRQVFIRR